MVIAIVGLPLRLIVTSSPGPGTALFDQLPATAQLVPSAGVDVARWPIFVIGLAVMILGFALRQWSVLTLGQFFTVQVQVRTCQTVVETGPYKWLRHPSYTAIIMSFVGVGVALENWLSLLVLIVVPTVGLVIRIRIEERALLEALGEPYREFSATRARLIPNVW